MLKFIKEDGFIEKYNRRIRMIIAECSCGKQLRITRGMTPLDSLITPIVNKNMRWAGIKNP